jgi:hypothetical protein
VINEDSGDEMAEDVMLDNMHESELDDDKKSEKESLFDEDGALK